jgi:hypothetical protein
MIDIQENVALCSRGMLTSIMDGASLKRQCSDMPGCNPCHVCDPDSNMAVFARQAILTPLPPKPGKSTTAMLPAAPQAVPPPGSSLMRPADLIPAKPVPGFTTAAAMLCPAAQAVPSPRPSIARSPIMVEPSSDDFGSEAFTPSMAEEMDLLEQSFRTASTTTVASSRSLTLTPVAR